jgi:hypothetical protein
MLGVEGTTAVSGEGDRVADIVPFTEAGHRGERMGNYHS